MHVAERDATLDLVLAPPHAPVAQLSRTPVRRDDAYPRLAARGTLALGGHRMSVGGIFWLDRESGAPELPAPGVGRERFTIVLDDGRALFVSLERRAGGGTEIVRGALIDRRGRVTSLGARDIAVENPLATTWRNSRGVLYPSLWEIFVREARLDLAVVPVVQAQEIDPGIRGARFYDGSVDVERASPGPRDTGAGFVEVILPSP
ncbi:MAG: hypothetical protein IAI49_06585 [Candidatus Eremiobacteraeota bacterium]|nr:hypothetical protein [Candidatus Eremiobacteraeota bacterium]